MGFLNTEKIRARMRELGIKKVTLGSLTGISDRTLSDILGGGSISPTIGNVAAIAKALDCSVDYLLLDPPHGSSVPLHPAVRELAAIIDDLNDQGIDRLMQNARDIAAIGYYKKGHSAISGEELA